MTAIWKAAKAYSKSIFVREWIEPFPDCYVTNVTPVHTDNDDNQVPADGPCPEGFKLEYQVESIYKSLAKETVTVASIRVPVLSCEYDEETVCDEVKERINVLLAEEMVKVAAAVIVLDGPSGNSTKAFITGGLSDIVVPNPAIKTIHGATVVPTLLIFYLMNAPIFSSHLYADTTGEWAGCETGLQVKVDIELFLSRGFLPFEGGILAITVCMRHLTLPKRLTHLDDMQREIGNMSNYAFERVHGEFYRNNKMAVLVLRSVLPNKRRRMTRDFFMDETHGGLMHKK